MPCNSRTSPATHKPTSRSLVRPVIAAEREGEHTADPAYQRQNTMDPFDRAIASRFGVRGALAFHCGCESERYSWWLYPTSPQPWSSAMSMIMFGGAPDVIIAAKAIVIKRMISLVFCLYTSGMALIRGHKNLCLPLHGYTEHAVDCLIHRTPRGTYFSF